MCGICGIIKTERNSSDILTMLSFLTRRGPDFNAFWEFENISMGHARLSIIDLSAEGHQPMHSISGRSVIVFNGEIYNFPALKKELLDSGYSFRSNSDTEVLLNGFEYWGIEILLQKIEGMFAFALYDKMERELFLVRDRLGKKPLYYYSDSTQFLFSSDIRSIHSLVKDKLSLDYESLDYYLTELSVPQPKTIWKEVKQLPPASYIIISDEKIEDPITYSKPKFGKHINIGLDEAVEESTKLIQKAIAKRCISDVPIGCFLSGGVDSGLVTALLAEQSSESINTFTIGLSHEQMNEMQDARIVAQRYSTNHTEIILEANILETLPELIEYSGEPFADSSLLPSHYVCKAISSHVKVALSGDGGDELFGGYNDYGLAYRSYAFSKKYPKGLLRNTVVLFDKIYGRIVSKKENAGAYHHYLSQEGARHLYRDMGFLDSSLLYHKDFKEQKTCFAVKKLQEIWDNYPDLLLPDRLMSASLNTRLLNDYLVKVDRASMYNSLEVRSPLLDTELLEFAFSLQPEIRFHGNVNKFILKQIAKKYIDSNIEKRPKRGFGIPVQEWLRKDMKNWAASIIFDRLLSRKSLFERAYIEKIWKEHQDCSQNHEHRLWSLICLEIWFQKFQ